MIWACPRIFGFRLHDGPVYGLYSFCRPLDWYTSTSEGLYDIHAYQPLIAYLAVLVYPTGYPMITRPPEKYFHIQQNTPTVPATRP